MPIRDMVERHFKTHVITEQGQLLSTIDPEAFLSAIAEVFGKFQIQYNPINPWFDKTPDAAMIEAAPILATLWPSAVFVFARRRALENVVSRVKKFPSASFEAHCGSWAQSMAAWRGVRDSGISAIEIDQYDVAHEPDATAARLAAFLALSGQSVTELLLEMKNSRPQRSDEHSTHRVLSLEACGWSDRQIETFQSRCSGEMAAYGYTLDQSYREGEFASTV